MDIIDKKRIDQIGDINRKRLVELPDKTKVSSIGQGTWYIGERSKDKEREIDALRLGIEFGMNLIDTVEMYGSDCVTNQVLYHLGSRGVDFDLLPWQREHKMPIMAYCPVAQGGSLRRELLKNATINKIVESHKVKPMQIILAWCIRSKDVIAIPKAAQLEHVLENAEAASIILSENELAELDKAFPKPNSKVSLDIV